MRGGREWGLPAVVGLVVAGAATAGVYTLVDAPDAEAPTRLEAPAPDAPAAQPLATVAPPQGGTPVAPEAEPVRPPGWLDPDTLPTRPVEQARVAITENGRLLLLDHATGAWVVAEVPETWAWGTLHLSPDGRHLARVSATARGVVETIELGSGRVSSMRLPLDPADCRTDGVAWSPEGGRLAVVSGCSRVGPDRKQGGHEAWVHEVTVPDGGSRVLERVPDAFPAEAYPTWSPDGAMIAYGIGHVDGPEAELLTLRVLDARGELVAEWPDLHPVFHGDPWRDDETLIAWDELVGAPDPDAYVLVRPRAGTREPLGIADLFNTYGFIAGALLLDRTPWLDRPPPCPVAVCVVEPGTGAITEWLSLPGDRRMVAVSPARDLVAVR